jgi:hypothetical protein
MKFHEVTTSVFEKGQMSKAMASKLDDDTDGLIDRMECNSYEVASWQAASRLEGRRGVEDTSANEKSEEKREKRMKMNEGCDKWT